MPKCRLALHGEISVLHAICLWFLELENCLQIQVSLPLSQIRSLPFLHVYFSFPSFPGPGHLHTVQAIRLHSIEYYEFSLFSLPFSLFHFLDIRQDPGLVEESLCRRIKTEVGEPGSALYRLHPVFLLAFGGFWAEVEVNRAVGIGEQFHA